MIVKLFGAFCVVLGCGGFGFMIASNVRKEILALKQLINVLDFVECDMNYRMVPLEQLFRSAAAIGNGCISHMFLSLADELERRSAYSVEKCVYIAISKCPDLPPLIVQRIIELGKTLGRFELKEQVKCLHSFNIENLKLLDKLSEDNTSRMRGYRTLGLCAGAALVILFI